MTNTNTTRTESHVDDDHATPAAPSMTSWTMATSILVGINKALRKAEEERAAILSKHEGSPFAPCLSTITQTIEALLDAKKTLGPDLHRTARSSGLPMPEGV